MGGDENQTGFGKPLGRGGIFIPPKRDWVYLVEQVVQSIGVNWARVMSLRFAV